MVVQELRLHILGIALALKHSTQLFSISEIPEVRIQPEDNVNASCHNSHSPEEDWNLWQRRLTVRFSSIC